MTAFSNSKINFFKLHPGELKQFNIKWKDNTKLFFKIPSNGVIYKAELSIYSIVGLNSIRDYRKSLKFERYKKGNQLPCLLVDEEDYTIAKSGDIIIMKLINTSPGLYALRFDNELKNVDFEIVLRLSFNDLTVIDAFSTQQVRIPANNAVNYQIPVAKSGVWDLNGYSCVGPLEIYFNSKEPSFHD